MELCGAEGPDGVTCNQELGHRDPVHLAALGVNHLVSWPNEDYIAGPASPRTLQEFNSMANEIADNSDRKTHAIRPNGRRSVGRSSVQPRDVEAAEEGMGTAHEAMEQEFVDAVYEAIPALASRIRITTDDIWEWTDDHDCFTDHPKGMAGLLKRLIKDRFISPVPMDDPDAYRPSKRSNLSRRLRVYDIISAG